MQLIYTQSTVYSSTSENMHKHEYVKMLIVWGQSDRSTMQHFFVTANT